MYIYDHSSSPLIVVIPTESAPEDQDSPVNQGSTVNQGSSVNQDLAVNQGSPVNTNQSSSVSPLSSGSSKLLSLCIEGKKDHYDKVKLKYQLWANMIVVATTEFMNSVKNSKTKKRGSFCSFPTFSIWDGM